MGLVLRRASDERRLHRWRSLTGMRGRNLSVVARHDAIPRSETVTITQVANTPVSTEEIPAESNRTVARVPAEKSRAVAIVVLCFLVTVICALDRAAMSVAILPMATEFGYTDGQKGSVGSAYFWGYTVSNVFSGVLCTMVSPKLILALGVIFWSAFTVLTPVAASSSLPLLLACRALMGASEGACLPTIQAILANWVPKTERSRALALVTTGITAGTVGALFLAPLIVQSLGWPSVFIIFGGVGFVWSALWLPTAEDAPKSNLECVPYECELNWDSMERTQKVWGDIPWKQLFDSTAFRGVVAVSLAHNTGNLLLLSWLPSYFADTFGRNVSDASSLAAPPWIAAFIVGNLAGWLADEMTARGVATVDIRRGCQMIGSFGPALCLGRLALGPTTESEAVMWFTAALGLGAFSYAGFSAASQDMARRNASLLYGVFNALGCLAGSLAVWLTGVALEANPDAGFGSVFGAAACVYAIGGACFLPTYIGKQEFD